MKRMIWLLLLVATTSLYAQEYGVTLRMRFTSAPSAYVPYTFQASDSTQVLFAPGNLQYRRNDSINGPWHFAEHQYDCAYYTVVNIDYKHWFDAFGYGTSGYYDTDPMSTGGGYMTYPYCGALADNPKFDWGYYNAIKNGGDKPGLWRTPTQPEWDYILNKRHDALLKRGSGTVNGIYGVILLPNQWVLPQGLSFKPISNNYVDWEDNEYSAEEWCLMEKNGAVFLPASGTRNSTTMFAGTGGGYWSGTPYNNWDSVYTFDFCNNNNVNRFDAAFPVALRYGNAVRLVQVGPDTLRRQSERELTVYCGSYEWNKQVYTQSGVYTQTFTTPRGDSTAILYLTIEDHREESYVHDEVCATRPIVFHGDTIRQPGSYTYHLTNRYGCDSIVYLTLTPKSCPPEGALPGVFSIGYGKEAYVAIGNLEYNVGGDDPTGPYRFHTPQYTNATGSSTYWPNRKWHNSFGYGCRTYIKVDAASCTDDDITGTDRDWGYEYAITNGGNQAGLWRTPTASEWQYIIYARPDADSKRGFARVGYNNGFVLLPDNFTYPDGIDPIVTADQNKSFEANVYTEAQWNLMENHGAMFLPAEGYRWIGTVNNPYMTKVGQIGNYWGSTDTYTFGFGFETEFSTEDYDRHEVMYYGDHGYGYGHSVRLIQDKVDPCSKPGSTDAVTIYDEISSCVPYNWNGQIITSAGTYQQTLTNQQGCDSIVTLILTEVPCAPEGAISGIFSVSGLRRVYFAVGNLEYNANDLTNGPWRFKTNQYDMSSAAWTDRTWRDLFGYGTGTMPAEESSSEVTYPEKNISATADDWGSNAIRNGGNTANLWRTLTQSEWNYLMNVRTGAANKWGLATIGSVHGMVILPDTWNQPFGATFTPGLANGFATNTYTLAQWNLMERRGAVFLPAAGRRAWSNIKKAQVVSELNTQGEYWTGSYLSTILFDATQVDTEADAKAAHGHCVRLVQEVK